MAFTKTPENNTYQTKQVSLIREFDSRNQTNNYDVDNLNCFFELIKNKLTEPVFHVSKRAGTSTFGSALPSTNVRGLYYWEDQDRVFVAVDNDIRVINAATGATVTTLNNVFGTTSGEVGFTEFLYDDASVKLVATDGTTMITVDSANTVVTGADADMPVHLPQPIFLDGYLFIVKADSADIYNSNLNDPLAYTAGNFISSEMFADSIIRIAKLNNYLVAFGSYSIEYFWDAANPSGSPLQRNDTPIKLTGFLGGFGQNGNKIYFVGNTSAGTPTVYEMEDFKITEKGNPSLRKYLEVLDVSYDAIFGNVVSFLGHDFYVINVQGALTYMMDCETSLWSRLGFQATNTFNITNAIDVKINSEYASLFVLSGALYRFEQDKYQDNSVNFTMRVVTDKQMFDSYNQKVQHRLIVVGDRPSANSNVSVSWTDDDYQSYNTAQTVNMNQELPSLTRGGRFRRRAYKLEYTDNYPLRIRYLELDINLGQH